jgi:Domain of unknown function (DUF6089)
MRFWTTCVIFILYMNIASGQDIQIGAMGGMTLFQGDYPSFRLKDTFTILANPGFGFFLRKPINDRLSIKGSFYLTAFEGDDALDPNLVGLRTPSSFKYAASELLITAEYAPLQFELGGHQTDVYGLGGVGFSKTTFKNSVIDDGCPVVNLVLPIGIGIRSKISDLLTLSIQFESVHALNDCLDGFKGLSKTNDVYSSLKLGLSYGLSATGSSLNGKSIGCPTF